MSILFDLDGSLTDPLERVESIFIRPGRPADASAISALIDSLDHFRSDIPLGPPPASFAFATSPEGIQRCLGDPAVRYLVAELGGEVVGVLGIRNHTTLFHCFVATKHHRKGIARKLWERAKAEALATGNLGEFNVRSSLYAVPAYERFGFKVTGPRVDREDVSYVPMAMKASDVEQRS